MAVPNIFGSATSAIPLSQLDTNFATPVTIGNTAVQLGNTVTSFGNVTLTNVTISSGNVTVTGANVSGTANVSTLVVTGNAVVSVTDNTNAALRITQLGTGNALLVEDTTNPDATPFVIDAGGNTVVGATSAYATVDSSNTARTPLLQNHGLTQSTANTGIFNWSSSTGSAAYLSLNKSKSGTVGTQTAVSSGDDIGAINFAASDGTAFVTAANILAEVDGTPGTNDMPGRLVFSTTADGASTPTERMRIDSAGSVGIGSTSLTGRKVVVSGTVTGATTAYGIYGAVTFQSDATTHAYGIRSQSGTQAASFTLPLLSHYGASQGSFGATSTVTTQYGFNADSSLTGATNNYGFYGDIASGTNRWNLYMNGTADNYLAGDVGIGTTTPVTRLEIAGNNNITWSVTASITGTTMDVTAVTTSGVAVGDLVFGANIQAYTRVTALGTGTGGIGTYTVSVSQTAASGSVAGGPTYANTLIRITDTDTSQNIGQPNGGLQFFTSDTSSPTAGVGAYVAALAETVTPDTALVFGTRDNSGGGIDANERMRIDSSGNLLVGTTGTTSNARLAVTTSSTSNLDYGIYAKNSGGVFLLGIDNNGGFATGTAAGSPYNATTASAANVFVASSGLLQRSTSSLKYKTDVQDATHGLTDALKLRAVTYKGKNDGDTIFGGLIAEEVHEAGLTEFVQYAEDGTPDALSYGNMVSLAFKAIQEQQALITQLQADVAALKGTA
jgi:hypothetical protein